MAHETHELRETRDRLLVERDNARSDVEILTARNRKLAEALRKIAKAPHYDDCGYGTAYEDPRKIARAALREAGEEA